ncbi:MAG: alpha/beta hydrolase [Pseudomonadota bacterium]
MRETTPLEVLRPDTGRLIETALGGVFVTTTGDQGPPLLMTHGTGAWGGLWQETADALAAAGYKAHAMDVPPFGFSERAADWDYRRQAQADRILALVAAMGQKPIMVAHSFGAGPSVEAVMKQPDAFVGQVLVAGAVALNSHDSDATLAAPLRSSQLRRTVVSVSLNNPLVTKSGLAMMLHKKDQAQKRYVDILKRPMAGEGLTEAYAQWLPTLLTPPKDALSTRPESYRALTLPTVLIWGDKDTITPLAQGEELANLVPGAKLVVMKDIGHIPQIEDPAAFQKILIEALAGISAGAD